MEAKTKRIYEFGPFRLDSAELVLLCDGKPVYLKPKVLETLLVLVSNSGRVLDKETLMKQLWQDTFVEESNLAVNISQLRKALGQTEDGPQFIETLPRRGYRFTAEVRELREEDAAFVVTEYTASRITIEEKETTVEEEAMPARSNAIPAPGSASPSASKQNRFARILSKKLTAASAVALVAAIAASGLLLLNRTTAPGFRTLRIEALPNTGNSIRMAISPDGKFLAHVVLQDGRRGVLLRQLATGSDVQLVPPGEAAYDRLMFSRDGNNIYFLSRIQRAAAIYVMPAFGGATKRLMEDVSDFTLSPDNKRIAFLRNGERESSLIIADATGGDESTLAVLSKPDSFVHVAWSPDGELIACTVAAHQGNERRVGLVQIRVSDGKQQAITAEQWEQSYGLEWISDGSALILSASRIGLPSTLWFVSNPSGEVRRITMDGDSYADFTMTADSATLVCSQTETHRDLWRVPATLPNQAKRITNGASSYVEPSLTPDGKIVFVSRASGNSEIWVMDSDGTNQKQLTINDAPDRYPEPSVDGRFIVFVSDERIWRMDIDGNGLRQLTNGKQDRSPRLSPDGKWLVYVAADDSGPAIWKAPADGGEARRLTTRRSLCPSISPDGKYVACIQQESGGPPALVIMLLADGQPVKTISLPKSVLFGNLRWLPDASGIAYVDHRDGVSNIWVQPLNGSAPRQLTAFESDQINSFDISRDGTELVCSRGVFHYKLVLIRNED